MRSINSQLTPKGFGKVVLPPPLQNPSWYADATKQLADAIAKITALSQAQGNASYFTTALSELAAVQKDLDAAMQAAQQAQAQLTTLQSELDTCNLALATAKGAIGNTQGGGTGGSTGGTTTPTTGVSGATAALIGAASFAAGIAADEGARAVMKRRR